MRGPIDFIVVGFEGNSFDGSILRALGDVLDKGIVGLLALTLIRKDSKGAVTVADIEGLDDEYVVSLIKKYPGESKIVGKDDVDEVSELLQNNTAAGLLIVEHLWAIPLKKAIIDAKGVLVSDGRIHPEAAYELTKQ